MKLQLRFGQHAFPLDTLPVTIGRGPENGIVLDDQSLSRQHAEIRAEDKRIIVRDLGSKWGTFINGDRVEWGVIKPGDVVALGKVTLKVERARRGGAARAAAPVDWRGRAVRAVKWIGAAAVLVLAGLYALGRWTSTEPPAPRLPDAPGPRVSLAGLRPGDAVTALEPQPLVVSASDGERIDRVEVWVDGALVAARNSDRPEGSNPLVLPADWQPEAAGEHEVLVRAYSTDGRVSQTDVVPVVAVPPGHVVQPGDTAATIADALGTSVREVIAANPQLAGGGLPSVGSVIGLPGFDPGRAEGGEPFNASGSVIIDGYSKALPAPSGLTALDDASCGQARLAWSAAGAGVAGYHVYGVAPDSTANLLLKELPASATSVNIAAKAPGEWTFTVAALDASGREGALARATAHVAQCFNASGSVSEDLLPAALLDLWTTGSNPSRVYAYLRLGGSGNRYQRVPADPGSFLQASADGHFRADLPELGWPAGLALPLEVELWGWGGGELARLGFLDQTVSPSDWADGSVTLKSSDATAVIQTEAHAAAMEAAGVEVATVREPAAKLPPPYVMGFGNASWWCMLTQHPSLTQACFVNGNWTRFVFWDWPAVRWTGPAATVNDLSKFQFLYQVTSDATGLATSEEYLDVPFPTVHGWPVDLETRARALPCGTRGSLFMRAVSEDDMSRADSDWVFVSNTAPSNCRTAITLNFMTLQVFKADDGYGDDTLEAYAHLQVGPHVWEPAKCSGDPCSTQNVRKRTYQWGELDELFRETARGPITVYLNESEDLSISARFYDYDSNSGDDRWCSVEAALPARSTEEWSRFASDNNFILALKNPEGKRDCQITVNIRVDDASVIASGATENLGALRPEANGCGSQEGGLIDPPNLWFGEACKAHDYCYFGAISGKSKQTCDAEFLTDMYAACADAGLAELAPCLSAARVYYRAVVLGGRGSYIGDTSVLGCFEAQTLLYSLPSPDDVSSYILPASLDCVAANTVAPVLGHVWDAGASTVRAGAQAAEDTYEVGKKGVEVAGDAAVGTGKAIGSGAKKACGWVGICD